MSENIKIPKEYVERLEYADIENKLGAFCKSKGVELLSWQKRFAMHVLSFKDDTFHLFSRGGGRTFIFRILDEFLSAENIQHHPQKQA